MNAFLIGPLKIEMDHLNSAFQTFKGSIRLFPFDAQHQPYMVPFMMVVNKVTMNSDPKQPTHKSIAVSFKMRNKEVLFFWLSTKIMLNQRQHRKGMK